jgi:photosystem II stability/assembly factor-like uncharacterized protein
MKRLHVFACVGILCACFIGIGKAETHNYHGVSFLSDGLNAWVATLEKFPIIMHTSDGGNSWEESPSGSSYRLFDIFFLNDTLGWTAGNLGEIRYTNDGGESWTQQSSGFTKYFCRIYFVDENFGWTSGGDGIIGRTENGGASWQDVYLSSPCDDSDYYGVSFIDSLNGWIAGGVPVDSGGQGYILRTANGGRTGTWIPQRMDTVNDLLDIHFVNIDEGWAVGGNDLTDEPVILHSINGGGTWNEQTVPGGSYLRGVHFVSETEGFAVGKNGTILHTSNGGTYWELQNSGVSVTLFDVDFADSLKGLAVGYSSTILLTEDGGKNWQRVGVEEEQTVQVAGSRLQVHPNPFTHNAVVEFGVHSLEFVDGELSTLNIYDLGGRLVENTDRNVVGERLEAGIYFLKAKGYEPQKIVKLR